MCDGVCQNNSVDVWLGLEWGKVKNYEKCVPIARKICSAVAWQNAPSELNWISACSGCSLTQSDCINDRVCRLMKLCKIYAFKRGSLFCLLIFALWASCAWPLSPIPSCHFDSEWMAGHRQYVELLKFNKNQQSWRHWQARTKQTMPSVCRFADATDSLRY